MENRVPGVTPLDEALDVARDDASRSHFFFDAFLNADLMMPVLAANGSPAWRQLGRQDRFQPFSLAYEQTRVIPVFDRLDRMQAWAQGKTLDYLQLRCHILLQLVAAEAGIVLNLATHWTYYFSPETLGQIRNAMKPVTSS
jgi:hypothetical protein